MESSEQFNMEGLPVPEIDPNFEPQIRARSNTWPVRPKEFDADSEGARTPNSVNSETDKDLDQKPDIKPDPLSLNQKKASGSRRNAWGNLSYADLITKAIQSSPEGRLTLSQIYDWMVQNVPYFRDKGDSNSSAGWKNSIRHNLSLHSRFMRVQNEGTGKSSWWVLNPEAKPGKSPRRRATSMDTKEYAKKRGRVKRKVDQLRAAMEGDTSSYGSTHELTDPFCLSPNEYRQRASSNASSLGGRLSPITSQYGEFDDTIPDGPWSRPLHDPGFSEISETFAGMLMEDYNDGTLQDSLVTSSATAVQLQQSASPLHQQLSPAGYPDQNATYLQVGAGAYQRSPQQQQLSPQAVCSRSSPASNMPASLSKSPNGFHHTPPGGGLVNNLVGVGGMPRHQRRSPFMGQSLTELLEQPDGLEEAMDDSNASTPTQAPPQPQRVMNGLPPQPPPPPPQMTGTVNVSQQQQVQANNQFMSAGTNATAGVTSQVRNVANGDRSATTGTLLGGVNITNLTQQERATLTTSLLRRVLTDVPGLPPAAASLQQQAPPATYKQFMHAQQQQANGFTRAGAGAAPQLQHMSGGSMQTAYQVGASMAPPSARADSELEFLNDCMPAAFNDCPDLNELISHELTHGGLDFNFDPNNSQQDQQQQPPSGEQTRFNGAGSS